MLSPKQLAICAWKAAVNTINHDGIEHAGYLAFLGLLALFPFLVFTVSLVGFLGQGEAGASFITTTMLSLPGHITAALKPRVVEIISGPPQGLLTASILGAIWTASSAVEGLRTVLNRAYHVATPPAYWFRRSLSIVQLLIFTFVTVSGMMVMVLIPLIFHYLEDLLGIHFISDHQQYWGRMAFIATVGLVFIAVSSVYYSIPNIRQRLIAVVPGALLVSGGWVGAARLVTLYLSNFNQVNLIYGSLGGIIAALVFFYICNIIFIFGAEFNYQIVHTLGVQIVEKEAGIAPLANAD
jgi:membrane protein